MTPTEPLTPPPPDESAVPITGPRVWKPGDIVTHGSLPPAEYVGTFTGTMILLKLADGTEVGVLP